MGQKDQHNDGLGSTTAAAQEVDGLKDRFCDLDFSARKSRRYHERLCAFYGGWRDWVKIVTVASGSGLFVLVLGDHKVAAEFLAGFVALWAIASLASP